MSAQPLLHSSLKPRIEKALLIVGVFCVLVGAADAMSRLARATLGAQGGQVAFAPLAAVNNNAIYGSPLSTSTGGIVPIKLRIPSIGVSANVQHVGKKADGSMGTPTNFWDAAWYELGPKPGDAGNAVIDGHVNNALTTSGVFMHLSQVKQGDQVFVIDATGRTLTFVVTKVEDVPADAPSTDIFATSGPSQLVLISCDGDWVSSEHQFNERLIVWASLAH